MKIALIGYGKMGKAIEVVATEAGHFISHKIESKAQLEELLTETPDIAIEFTQPEAAFENIKFCIENNIPVLTGTTGWLDRLPEIEQLCIDHSGTFLTASNFSIGVNLFFELNTWLASKMNKLGFDCTLEEIHHTEKKDSPSGTAITLAEGIINQNSTIQSWVNEESTDQTKLSIISKRKPNVPGTHTVFYTSDLESIEISHIAHDRGVFAQGVMAVAEWIKDKKGVLTMADFLNQ